MKQNLLFSILIIFFLLLNKVVSGQETSNSDKNISVKDKIITKVTDDFFKILMDKDSVCFSKLVENKSNFLPKIYTDEKEVYENQLRELGFNDNLIEDVLNEKEHELIQAFSKIDSFILFLDLKKDEDMSKVLSNPFVLNETDSTIEIVFPFLKWGEKMYPLTSKAIVWVFKKDIKNTKLLDVVYDYNMNRTNSSDELDYGEVYLTLSSIRSLVYDKRSFHLSITLKTTKDKLAEAKNSFKMFISEFKFPVTIGDFEAVKNINTDSFSSINQMGSSYFIVYNVEYHSRNVKVGAQLLPPIEMNFMGCKLKLDKPMLISKPYDW